MYAGAASICQPRQFVAAGVLQRIENWSLTSLQQWLVQTDGRLVKHARYCWLLLAESQPTKRLLAVCTGGIAGLSLPVG